MSNERRNLVVTALLLSLMCNSVGGSRLMKLTVSSSSRAVVVNTVEPWKQPPPPPPLYIQWPPTHHHVRHHQSPPPAPTSAPTPEPAPAPTPPAVHNNVTSSPPPPPDQGTTTLNAKHSQPNGRRLFSSGERDADFGSNQFLLGTDHESSVGECAGGALAPGATHEAGIPFGGSGYGPVPEGAPVPGVVPVIPGPGPGPAPAPAPGISSGSVPALAPSVAGDNSTMAHSTMVSAMKYNQCTYTVITSTGNIEGAGTKADVNAEFFDKFGSSVLFVNLRSQNRNFEQGATDTFTVVGDCVQNICKMHLSHDDSGPNPGWFVNTVTVSVLYQTHVFNVFEWLAKDEPPYSLSRVVSSCPAL